jgi:hypothetical protein
MVAIAAPGTVTATVAVWVVLEYVPALDGSGA